MLIGVGTFLYLAEKGLLRSPWGVFYRGGLIHRVDVGGFYLNVKEIVSLIFQTPALCQSKPRYCCLVYPIYRVVDLEQPCWWRYGNMKKKNRNKESVGKMSTEKSCCQKSKTKHHENHNLSYFLSLGCRHLLIQSFLVSGLLTSSLQ